MTDLFRKNLKQSVFILLVPMLIAGVYMALAVNYTYTQNEGYVGALLDDTWIHVRFAESLSEGRGLSYNEGEITTGATSPLWVLLLAGVYRLVDPSIMTQVHLAIGLSALSTVLTAGLITGFGWWYSRRAWVGLLAGVLTALTGRYIWMGLSGMETTLFAALCIVALWSHTDDMQQGRTFGWRTGIWVALATLGRPEGYLLAAVIGGDAFVLMPLVYGGWRRLKAGWRGIVAYVMLAGSYLLASFLMTGHLLPNTFRAKSQLGKEFPDLPYAYFWTPRVDHGWLLIVLAAVGIAYLLWRNLKQTQHIGFAWALWPVAFVLGVLFLGANHYVINNGRYVAPAIPFHALAAAIGVWIIGDYINRRWSVRAGYAPFGPLVLSVMLVAMVMWNGRGATAGIANDSNQLYQMHVTAGEWFKQYTKPDETIALNDVGAITHISDRRVLDMVGLVSPEITEAIQDEPRFTCPHDLQIARVMLEQEPRLVGIFPWFFPCLSAWQGALQPFTQFEISGPTVIANGTLIVYWPVWENWPLQRAIAADALAADADFEQGISLAAYSWSWAADGLHIELWWLAKSRPEGDYTVFIHVINADDEIVAQLDQRPQHGQFNTQWWRTGDIIRDPLLIADLQPDATLRLRVGLYPTGGGTNLPRVAAPIEQEEFVILPLK